MCFQDIDKEIRHLEVPSPDGSTMLVVDGYEGKFNKRGQSAGKSFTLGRDEEVIWSPDSQAIIVSLSLGGTGPVAAGVVYVSPRGFEAPDVTKAIRKDFASRHPNVPCNESVNVAGLSWEGSSLRAVFLAEVPSSSACGDLMGRFEAYVVSLPDGKILTRYTQNDTVKRWRKVLSPQMLSE